MASTFPLATQYLCWVHVHPDQTMQHSCPELPRLAQARIFQALPYNVILILRGRPIVSGEDGGCVGEVVISVWAMEQAHLQNSCFISICH